MINTAILLDFLSDGEWHSHKELTDELGFNTGIQFLVKCGKVQRRETTVSGDHWTIEYRIRRTK